MNMTITGNFSSSEQIRNAREDLIASGIPQEQLFTDEKHNQLKVMAPAEVEPEIMEILNRHAPQGVDESKPDKPVH